MLHEVFERGSPDDGRENQREDVEDRIAGLDADGHCMGQRVAVMVDNEHGVVGANDQ
jgi:hypothetical protein